MTLAGISLRDLEYVVAVADQASFVRAAELCNVSQPSLSAQVRKVEGWAGGELFERTSRKVMLTSRGARFVEQARRVLEEARALAQLSGAEDRPFGGTLRLYAIATLGPYLFPRILGPLRQRFPDVGLVLGEGLTDTLTAMLRAGDLDCVLMSGPVEDPALEHEAIFREPFLLASPTSRPSDRSPRRCGAPCRRRSAWSWPRAIACATRRSPSAPMSARRTATAPAWRRSNTWWRRARG